VLSVDIRCLTFVDRTIFNWTVLVFDAFDDYCMKIVMPNLNKEAFDRKKIMMVKTN